MSQTTIFKGMYCFCMRNLFPKIGKKFFIPSLNMALKSMYPVYNLQLLALYQFNLQSRLCVRILRICAIKKSLYPRYKKIILFLSVILLKKIVEFPAIFMPAFHRFIDFTLKIIPRIMYYLKTLI